jgi:hypothetical protein
VMAITAQGRGWGGVGGVSNPLPPTAGSCSFQGTCEVMSALGWHWAVFGLVPPSTRHKAVN